MPVSIFPTGRFSVSAWVGIGPRTSSLTKAAPLVTHQPGDVGRFKTPGLRDVEKHPPYMHDGSLATLREVVEFYNRGGTPHPHKSGRIVPLRLTSEQLDALVAFLQSLNGEGYQDRRPLYFPQ